MIKPVVLMILDGWGLAEKGCGNAVDLAHTPNYDRLLDRYPHSALTASGEAVGLPEGQQGNSEVGHLNLGAGRVVYQELTRINKAIREQTFERNQAFGDVMDYCLREDKPLHLLGLVSDGGVHSHMAHLLALVRMCRDKGLTQVYLHCFLDGRDVAPASAADYIAELERQLAEIGVGCVATLCGRYYAMDRDNRWERVEQAYRLMTEGIGQHAHSACDAIAASYAQGVTDEFVLPAVITQSDGAPVALIGAGDGVIFANFRADRAREISKCFVLQDFAAFERKYLGVYFVGMTQYEEGLPMAVAYPPEELVNTLGEVISRAGLRQFRAAETEKYAHVTFFFNGGAETANPAEERVLVPSPQVATYDLQPQMSAPAVTEELLKAIDSGQYAFMLVNYANADMVGHTGDLQAAIQAVEAVDAGMGRIAEAVLARQGILLITADHGNAECMIDTKTGEPYTAHTANQVPFILVSGEQYALRDGILADAAPTVLHLLAIEQPQQMTGQCLIQ